MNPSAHALELLSAAIGRHSTFWKSAKHPAQFVIHTTLEELRASINEAVYFLHQEDAKAATPKVAEPAPPPASVPVAPVTPAVAPVPGPAVEVSPGPSLKSGLPPSTPGGVVLGEIHVDGAGRMQV